MANVGQLNLVGGFLMLTHNAAVAAIKQMGAYGELKRPVTRASGAVAGPTTTLARTLEQTCGHIEPEKQPNQQP